MKGDKTDYTYVGSGTSFNLGKSLPKELIPNKIMSYVFSGIFILVVLIGIAQFPFSKLMAGNVEVAIEIGIPYNFLVFDLMYPENSPIRFLNLVWDMLIWFLISYAINVAVNVFFKGAMSLTSNKQKNVKMYNLVKKGIGEKVAEKATEKVIEKKEEKETMKEKSKEGEVKLPALPKENSVETAKNRQGIGHPGNLFN